MQKTTKMTEQRDVTALTFGEVPVDDRPRCTERPGGRLPGVSEPLVQATRAI